MPDPCTLHYQIKGRTSFGNTILSYVFGSVLTDRFTDKSDIDLIVDIDSNDPLDYADNYFNLKFALEDLLNRQIDLLENKAIKNPYLRENIDNSKTLLYAS